VEKYRATHVSQKPNAGSCFWKASLSDVWNGILDMITRPEKGHTEIWAIVQEQDPIMFFKGRQNESMVGYLR
jgi:hypothetical protein